MANESTLLGEFCCGKEYIDSNNELLQSSNNTIKVFDRHNIYVPSFDKDVYYESYACFGKNLRFTEEEIFVEFAGDLAKSAPPLNVFGVRLVFFPQATLGIYTYSASYEDGRWRLPEKGEWHVPQM